MVGRKMLLSKMSEAEVVSRSWKAAHFPAHDAQRDALGNARLFKLYKKVSSMMCSICVSLCVQQQGMRELNHEYFS
jgi:hypothetical protein